MRSLVSWCLARRPVVILATVLILLGGMFGATQLRQQFFPDIDFPFVIASIDAPGIDANSLDTTVSNPVERAVKSVPDVKTVSTVASDGLVRVYVELAYGSDTSAVQDEIEAAIETVDLPANATGPDFAGGFSESAVVVGTFNAKDGDLTQLTKDAERVKSELEAVEGVGRVDIAGGSDPQLTVTLTPAAIQRGVTAEQVSAGIVDANERANAGVLPNAQGIPTSVVVEGPEIDDPAALRALTIPGLGTVGSVATVTASDAVDSGFAIANGKPAITFSVYRETGSDEVATVDGVLDVLDDAEQRLGDGSISVMYETASDIRASINGLLIEGLLGALFAVIVIFLFLRSVRSTLVAAISIPTSVVFGVLVAWMLGLTINIITLAGLTIAIGRVIDDGIVVLENVHKHLERGATRYRAMVDGTGEVATAIASSTIATAAVFLPIGLVGGLISEIFLSFSIIVTAALLASLLVAVTVIPVVGSFVLRPSTTPHDPSTDTLARMVVPATRFGIKWRWVVVPGAFVTMLAVFAAIGAGAIPTQFLPEDGANQIMGTVQLAPGTSVDDAKEQLAPLDERISEIDGLDSVQLTYGIESAQAAFDQSIGASTAEFFLTLDDDADAKAVENDLREFGAEQYPAGFSVMRLTNGPPTGSFQVNIEGDNQDSIAKAAEQIRTVLVDGAEKWDLVEIEAQAAQSIPQLVIRAKPNSPVSSKDLQAAVAGLTTPADAGTANGVPVTVNTTQSGAVAAGGEAALAAVPISLPAGGTAPLGELATFDQIDQPAFVNRVDGELSGNVTARMLGEDVAGTTKDIKSDVEDLTLPKGVSLDWSQGDQQFVNDMFADLGLAMVVAIVLVFFVLVVFFGSIAHPFTILAPILFSFIGSFGALIITGRPLGLPAMIGQLLLIGIIVSNSILLVDAALRLRRAGMHRDEALVAAAQLRVRPVLMTASATIAALLPLALGISGEGGIISQALGTVVIGGLLVATLLTLVIVPSVFRILDRDKDMTVSAEDPRDELPAPAPRAPAGVGTP